MFSYINAAFGAGAILGAIIATQGAKRLGPRAMFWGSLLFTGILLICYARNTFPALALLIFFLLGIPNSVSNAMTTPLLLDITPGPLVGRVVSVLLPTLTLMRILSTALAGYLASSVLTNFHADLFAIHFSTIDTLFIVAGLLTIAGGLYAQFNLQRHVKTKE